MSCTGGSGHTLATASVRRIDPVLGCDSLVDPSLPNAVTDAPYFHCLLLHPLRLCDARGRRREDDCEEWEEEDAHDDDER